MLRAQIVVKAIIIKEGAYTVSMRYQEQKVRQGGVEKMW
jgi:hypothetical protein